MLEFKYQLPLQPRASTTAPIVVKVFPGDENFSLFYAPVCTDGSTPSYYSSGLACPGTATITGTSVKATQLGFSHQIELANQVSGYYMIMIIFF